MPILTTANFLAEIEGRIVRTMNANIQDAMYSMGCDGTHNFAMVANGTGMSSISALAMHPAGLFTVSFDLESVPTMTLMGTNDGVTIKRTTIHFNGDRAMLPPKTRTQIYFPVSASGVVDVRKMAIRAVEMNEKYIQGVLAITTKREQAEALARAAEFAEKASLAQDERGR